MLYLVWIMPDIMVLINRERWYMTFFSQSTLISKLWLTNSQNWNSIIWGNTNYLSCFLFMFACEKLSQNYFISFVYQLLSTALQSTFNYVLAFPQWLFVPVENYQIKFCQIENNPFFKTSKIITVSYKALYILGNSTFSP